MLVIEKQIPIDYTCEKGKNKLYFRIKAFEKHSNSYFFNSDCKDINTITDFLERQDLNDMSFRDFYCPNCIPLIYIQFSGGLIGYWGGFFLEYKRIVFTHHIDKIKFN